MKKYKLIKEYPGSPELGSILTYGRTRGDYAYNNDNLNVFRHKNEIENQPEFWEEVVEKDYEILRVTPKSNHPNLPVGTVIDSWVNINMDYFDINSIKRLSDGEVFTVGDIINTKVDNKYKQEIIGINLGINGNFYKDRLTFKTKRGFVIINIAVKSKQPLFTTEDGVNIYEGDKYFELALTFKPQFREAIYEYTGRPNIYYDYNTLEGKKKLNEIGRYYFSTKKAAEEYILMNKPCLSINEVMSVAYNPVESRTSSSNKLKKIVKSKL